jgi:hypothetical protein
MKKINLLFVPLLLLVTACGSAFRVYHDLDPSANFDQYKTYSFLDFTEGNKKTITGIELERIRTSFARALEAKGLEYQEDASDIKVQITVYFREASDLSYGWHYPSSYNYIERALAIDIFEGSTKKHIWHGAAVGQVGRTSEERTEELPLQVEKILASYPVATALKEDI